jgi:hypothetical protein
MKIICIDYPNGLFYFFGTTEDSAKSSTPV